MGLRIPYSLARSRHLVLSLFFVSGFGSLVLEVLWLKELRLLFGSTSYAVAVTLSAFFLGLSLGAHVVGRRAHALGNPLRTYALLELGIAASALLYFLMLKAYYVAYGPLFGIFGNNRPIFLAVKLTLALGVLFPPSFLMGGTWPVLVQHLVRRPAQLGGTGSLLYAVNTVGAAAGAFGAGFYLPRFWGFDASYLFAVGLSTFVAAIAYLVSRSTGSAPLSDGTRRPIAERGVEEPRPLASRVVWSVAFLSGFVTLSLEVLWTRMFAQVLQNSVYSFSAILVTFLAALSAGAILAHVLSRKSGRPLLTLSLLLVLSGVAVAFSPYVFERLTGALSYVVAGSGWTGYVRAIFATSAAVMFVPALLVGSVFPYLLRIIQGGGVSPGRAVGRIASVNAVGAVVGPLVSGFLLLDAFGIWASIQLVAYVYLVLAAAILMYVPTVGTVVRSVPLGVLVVMVLTQRVIQLPVVKLGEGERLVQVWQGSDGTVAVVQDGDNLTLKLDNYYILGDSRSFVAEQMQAYLPLLIHPEPRSVFLLGLGTGITAAAALGQRVERVVATELIPNVVTAARKYFSAYNSGIFRDPRALVVVEDGRNYLLGTRETYDVIISDLFTPWHEGTGNLYTLEHFLTVRSRLREGGVFAQWLPLHQLSLREFLIIARTMAEVFPQLTLWRGDFSAARPIVALIGQSERRPLDPTTLAANIGELLSPSVSEGGNDEYMVGLFYIANLTLLRPTLERYPMNTDNRPVIEYLSPITQVDTAAREGRYMVGTRLREFYDSLMQQSPPEDDPYLELLPEAEVAYVRAGLDFYKYDSYRLANQVDSSRVFLDRFLERLPPQMRERARERGLEVPKP
jgi:spermidine synthase